MFENDLKEKGNHKRESVLGSLENCLEDFYRNIGMVGTDY